jgi:hypothetical protein
MYGSRSPEASWDEMVGDRSRMAAAVPAVPCGRISVDTVDGLVRGAYAKFSWTPKRVRRVQSALGAAVPS